jgi:hypothetical protein
MGQVVGTCEINFGYHNKRYSLFTGKGATSCGRGIVGRAITSISKANRIVAETTAADKPISISSSPLADWLWFL